MDRETRRHKKPFAVEWTYPNNDNAVERTFRYGFDEAWDMDVFKVKHTNRLGWVIGFGPSC